ncbi:MAG: hypothetical protein U0L49_10340 [Eubacterium sp.]|nr:hypothetical protein [Eubacterium sp.]
MSRDYYEDEEYNPLYTTLSKILRLILFVILVLVLAFIGRGAYTLGYSVFHETPVDEGEGREITVTIDPGMSVHDIGQLLQDSGVLSEDPMAFTIQELISDYHGDIQPGTYKLKTSMLSNDVLKVMSEGSVYEGETVSSSS